MLSVLLGAAGPGAAADFRCERGDATGVKETDAATAARLVCEEIRRVSGGQGAYRVSLSTLGKSVFVRAEREEPKATVEAQVEELEEIPKAAARIAESVVTGRPFGATQRVDNLLETEARASVTKKGDGVKFTLGIVSVFPTGQDATGAGMSIGLMYVTPRFALPVELRLAGSGSDYDEPGMGLFSISAGGRGYLGRGAVAGYAGGGLSMLRLSAREGEYPYGADNVDPDYFDASEFGVAPYVEAGIEILRLHRARLGLQVRADLPFESLESPAIEVPTYDDYRGGPLPTTVVVPAQSRYIAPVSFQVSVAF